MPLGPELAGDEQSRVLEATTSRLASILPDSGWGKVTPPIHDSLFVAPSSKTLATYVFVVERLSSSGWSLFAYGDCEPATPPAVAEGSYTFGDWWIGATPSPSDRTLKIWVETSYCNADFVGPSIWYSQSSITVTFWARLNPLSPPTPPAICPLESQMQPSTLTLAEPVGSRELLEGPAFAAKPVLSAGPTEPASSSS